MAVTALEIIEASYNRSSANDAGKLATDAELLAHLRRVYARFYTILVRARPDRYGSELVLDPLAGVPPTTDIFDAPLDVLLVANATGGRVHLIPAAERDLLWHHTPAVYRLGDAVVSRAKTGDPVAGDVLTLTVLAAPTVLAALATPLDGAFPDRHTQLLIDALALYLSAKDEGRDAAEHEKIEKEYAQSAAAFSAEFPTAPDAVEAVPGSRTAPHGGGS